jgi:hypothetical protein
MNILITSIYTTATFEYRFDSHSYLCVGKYEYMELMSVGVLFFLSGGEHDTDQ